MYLWKNLQKLQKQIINAEKLLIFLDYDGTIVPIASTPQKVKFPKKIKVFLEKINSHSAIYVSIVSGRSLEEIKKQISIPDLCYAGNHGLEWEINGKKHIYPKMNNYLKHLFRIKKTLIHLEVKYPGVVIEDKKLTLAIHYRQINRKYLSEFHTYIYSITKPLLDAFPIKLSKGKKIYEIKPAINWTKGDFVELAIRKLTTKKNLNNLTIYIGDDTTDEDVFFRLPNIVSIKVGKNSSMAKYYLNNHQETIMFLRWILKTKNLKNPFRNSE